MKKLLAFVVVLCVNFALPVKAETVKECYVKKGEATDVEKWTIDCEEMVEIDRDFLDALTEVTFKNHTIEIKNCTSTQEETYTYTLNGDFVWSLRVDLYRKYAPEISKCRLNVVVTKIEYYNCMRNVRSKMKIGVDDISEKILKELERIKTELEENCDA